jgi:hypothetical protein
MYHIMEVTTHHRATYSTVVSDPSFGLPPHKPSNVALVPAGDLQGRYHLSVKDVCNEALYTSFTLYCYLLVNVKGPGEHCELIEEAFQCSWPGSERSWTKAPRDENKSL